MLMDAVRRKLNSLLTEAVRKQTDALDPQLQCAKELKGIDVAQVLREEAGKISGVATFREIGRASVLMARLKKASGSERETIKTDLKRLVEALIERVEKESGELKTPKPFRQTLF